MTVSITDDETIPSLTESSSLCAIATFIENNICQVHQALDEAAYVWRQLALTLRAEVINISVGLPHPHHTTPMGKLSPELDVMGN